METQVGGGDPGGGGGGSGGGARRREHPSAWHPGGTRRVAPVQWQVVEGSGEYSGGGDAGGGEAQVWWHSQCVPRQWWRPRQVSTQCMVWHPGRRSARRGGRLQAGECRQVRRRQAPRWWRRRAGGARGGGESGSEA
ncbi:hypothetical protein GPJ56_007231 [Histomonas meleagridis]|nr:hypothetical protein GPJ56_007231 [Histomonas meleagridis]